MQKAFIQLHLSVLLAGFTGLFGKLITLHEVDIVWYRMMFTAVILIVFAGLPRISLRKLGGLAGVGALLGLHWMLFYGSIKASNISIGVICYALVGFFTAFFEPLVFHRRVRWTEVGFSLLTLAGLICVFSFDARYRYGILIGVASAAVAALYSVFNKKVSVDVRSRTALLYQMAAGLVVVTAIDPIYLHVFPAHDSVLVIPEGSNLWWLLCLSLFCTVGLYILQIQALRRLSAFTVNLSFNLEPCYTILIALLFFGEARELRMSFYIGMLLILTSVSLQTAKSLRDKSSGVPND
ncbi:MAG: DMT family transporter [Prevotella sp.]|nr:DMT family transporter [Prevotella sp.]